MSIPLLGIHPNSWKAMKAPRRAWTMTLNLGADSEAELVHALGQIALDFELGGLRSNFASGGVSSGFSGETIHDPEMTGERYQRELAEYLQVGRKVVVTPPPEMTMAEPEVSALGAREVVRVHADRPIPDNKPNQLLLFEERIRVVAKVKVNGEEVNLSTTFDAKRRSRALFDFGVFVAGCYPRAEILFLAEEKVPGAAVESLSEEERVL